MKSFIRYITFAICALGLASCAIIRGYRADGLYGPDIFSFEHCEHDTIAKGETSFLFPVAKTRADWIDTLHFYTHLPYCNNLTFVEAMDQESTTQGVLIIHNDSIVYERYWGDFSADRMATIFSVSKSITSLLCGIAVDDGYIRSIDDPVTKYLPELKGKDPRWERLTIRHLLDMRSGLDFDDEYEFNLKELKTVNAIARLNYGHNIMKQIRGLRFRCEPGTEFRYESMTSAILGVIIERASGIRYADYLSEKVWKPLQMESVALVNIDSRKHDVAHAFGGITLTIKDLAKIGRLYLNRGLWEGKRIVSEEWIRLSSEYDESNHGYHFNWYNLHYEGYDKSQYPGFYAIGIHEQVLYVNPYKNLIMVRIGMNNNGWAVIPVLFETLSHRWPDTKAACDKLPYRLFRSKKAEPMTEALPLVVFLHGAGERGDDNNAQLKHCINFFLDDTITSQYPFLLLAPQCPAEKRWVNTDWSLPEHRMESEPTAELLGMMAVVDSLINCGDVDPKRVYLTGISMGGFGVWDALQRWPEKFSAAIAICGGGDPAYANNLKDLPIHIFHGLRDGVVMPSRSIQMHHALKDAGNTEAVLITYPELGHECWNEAFSTPGIFKWLFGKTRNKYHR